MKKRSSLNLISIICLQCRYAPLFLLLLGVKICLLSFIADHIQESQKRSMLERHRHAVGRYRVPKQSQRPAEVIHNDKTVAPIPQDLVDLEINATSENRTSPTSIWLIYNSIPQCKDEQMVDLIDSLSQDNKFSHQDHEYQTPWPRFLLRQEQENLVSWFEYQHLPKSYSRHFFYVNFTQYQKYAKERPIYINIVRDPIDRLALDYYSRRNKSLTATKLEISRRNALQSGSGTEWYHRTFEECVLQADSECRYTAGEKSFILMMPFFCGQHNSCVVINDRWALQMAKFNIEREYSVVGVLEKMDQTLRVLEKFVPRFFSGAVQLYQKKLGKQSLSEPSKVSSSVRQIMESELFNEVELYKFIVQRLELQYRIKSN